MAARTTAAAGFYDDTATWNGGVVPVSGDTITTNHAVFVRDARTVGHSPGAADATAAILCNANLTILLGGALKCRGDVRLNTGGFYQQGGSSFEFDASLAASPSTARYVMGSPNTSAGAGIVVITGTNGSRCTVSSNSGGANGRFANAEGAQIDAAYCDFARIGDASNPAFSGWVYGSGHKLKFNNCTFDADCGSVGSISQVCSPDSNVEFSNFTHRGPVSIALQVETVTTGTRILNGARLAGTTTLYNVTGWDVYDVMFEAGYDFTGGPAKRWEKVMVAAPTTMNDFTTPGLAKDGYVVRVGNPTNHHGYTSDDNTVGWDGIIFDAPDCTDGAGDCITINNPSSPKLFTIDRVLVLPTESGTQVGTAVSCLGGVNAYIRVRHLTAFFGGGAAAIYMGETYAGHAGMLVECRSNSVWAAAANVAKVISADAGVIANIGLPDTISHNGKYNESGTGYDPLITFIGGRPGRGDVLGNPGFVDPTRNIKKWDLSLGGPGTVANALAELRKKNDAAGYNSAYTIDALRAYVLAGFAPTNELYLRGGHDNTTIGAVQVDVAPPLVFRRRVPINQAA
jgi:hypothetical protein